MASIGAPRSGGEKLGKYERIASLVAGGALAVLAMRRRGAARSAAGLAGAALVYRGASGISSLFRTTERGGKPSAAGFRGTARTAIARPADELYDFWRDFTTAPRFRDSITSVEVLDASTSRWTAAGPMGRSFQWTSRLTEDRPGALIAWESVEPSDVANRGSVRFTPFPGGTQVQYTLELDPPGGLVGEAILALFHQAPQAMLEEDLRRFRELMESGTRQPAR